VLARLHRVTGIEACAPLAKALPPAFLAVPAPSPTDLLTRLRLGRRTMNALIRATDAPPSSEPWTYGRLLEVRGFGVAALVEVLEGLATQSVAKESGGPRTVGEELARLPANASQALALSTPLLERALAAIAVDLPGSERAVLARLEAQGLVDGPVDLAMIERAARFYARPMPFAVLRREGLVVVVPTEKLAPSMRAYYMASRGIVTWGLISIGDIHSRLGSESVEFVTRLFAAHRSFQWLDEDGGWFWFGNVRSPLVRTIERVLAVAGRARLAELSRALFRRRAPRRVPSLRALEELCRNVPWLRVERQMVHLSRGPATTELLTDSDRRVVELFRTLGPRIDLRGAAPSFGTGHDLPGTVRRLRASPLVLEPRPHVFQLIGS
jgi:hypothetical protein